MNARINLKFDLNARIVKKKCLKYQKKNKQNKQTYLRNNENVNCVGDDDGVGECGDNDGDKITTGKEGGREREGKWEGDKGKREKGWGTLCSELDMSTSPPSLVHPRLVQLR